VTDAVDLVAEGGQRAGHCVDRRRRVELRHGTLAEAERQIVGLQIVSETDPHIRLLAATLRYDCLPSVPCGSG
jgi:hypothetical protein